VLTGNGVEFNDHTAVQTGGGDIAGTFAVSVDSLGVLVGASCAALIAGTFAVPLVVAIGAGLKAADGANAVFHSMLAGYSFDIEDLAAFLAYGGVVLTGHAVLMIGLFGVGAFFTADSADAVFPIVLIALFLGLFEAADGADTVFEIVGCGGGIHFHLLAALGATLGVVCAVSAARLDVSLILIVGMGCAADGASLSLVPDMLIVLALFSSLNCAADSADAVNEGVGSRGLYHFHLSVADRAGLGIVRAAGAAGLDMGNSRVMGVGLAALGAGSALIPVVLASLLIDLSCAADSAKAINESMGSRSLYHFHLLVANRATLCVVCAAGAAGLDVSLVAVMGVGLAALGAGSVVPGMAAGILIYFFCAALSADTANKVVSLGCVVLICTIGHTADGALCRFPAAGNAVGLLPGLPVMRALCLALQNSTLTVLIAPVMVAIGAAGCQSINGDKAYDQDKNQKHCKNLLHYCHPPILLID